MNAEELALALGGKKSGRQWACKCVAHEDSNPSMIIFDGREDGKVQVRCMAGCTPDEIIDVLRSRGLWHDDDQAKPIESAKTRERREQRERQEQEQRKQGHRMRLLARGIFDEAKPMRGSLAETYFESRDDLWSVARMIDDIRYHPLCPRGDKRQPAVVIAFRSVATNAVVAIQRIFLTKSGRKDAAMMLAPTTGAAMKLQLLQNHTLHVCEGLETGLAIIAMDKGPVWALGSAPNIQSFDVLTSINELYIWADHDPIDFKTGRSPGLHAAEVCATRWLKAGKQCQIYKARRTGMDEADVWRERNGRL
jgi:putative DNA primase/helicase